MIITILRYLFLKDRTIGKLFINGEFFSYTLEDPVRADGVKVFGETAIQQGVYKVQVTNSPTFGRPLPLVFGVEQFKGIRFHRGNSPRDTEGCVLTGYQFDRNTTNVWQSTQSEIDLVSKLGQGEHILVVVNDLNGVIL